jgi:quinol monooxygenase YgiN
VAELNVIAVLTAKPGSESIVAQSLTDLVGSTRSEPGCLSYELFASSADPTVFVTIEKWRSQEDVDAHMQTEHIAHVIATAGEHFGAPPAIHPLAPIETAESS